ncbi:response regulator [Hydrococcus rivularis NIES-593]|uniref:Response regulator n=1 Tax=Hydrococcus rivularis NIES-593 TaxID=1921803 RepID=A0A1U7HQ34_9CYAN|nr:response regulator [Hydrococcus rivularis]OKH25635.1 response regulator [Hydrococcus rivularis NIES-593]
MTTANPSSQSPLIIRDFNAEKQAEFFEKLKQNRFSGQLVLTNPKGERWFFYFYLSRIIYATGGIHPVRRWRRNLITYFPQIASQPSTVQVDLANIAPDKLKICWEYELLCLWVEQQKIMREQAAKMIRASIVEILFDITQGMAVACEIKPNILLPPRLVLIDGEQVIAESQQSWQAWQEAKIADRSPNSAPIIRQSEQLQQKTSPQVYQTLSQLLDGQQTLRDLSIRMKRHVLPVISSLLPYIQMGLVELISVPDLASPVAPPPTPSGGTPAPITSGKAPLIACVDDSPLMCQTMEKILTAANYQFVGINDPLRAIAILLARKPDLIFLDLVMPNANGYEICGQLRRMTFFKDTPIVILTGNDGIVDRVRAKMVGSTDFISKPVDPEIVIGTIRKHLRQESLA